MANTIPIDQLTNFGSSVTIEELDKPSAKSKPRKVILLGPGLPFQGAEWGFENQILTTWYPGNGTEATQQNLGPRELPSNWEGEWKRTLMGKSPCLYVDENGAQQVIVSPYLLRDILEDIARAGLRLRVTWNVSGNTVIGNPNDKNKRSDRYQIVREGRIKSCKTPITRHTDITWNIEYHWMSRGGRIDRIASVREDEDYKKISAALEAAVNVSVEKANSKVVSSKATIRKSANNFTLGQLESFVGGIASVTDYTRKLQVAIGDVTRFGNLVGTLKSIPSGVATTMVDFARNTSSVSNAFLDGLGREPAEVQTSKTGVSDILRSAKFYAEQHIAAEMVARRGYELDRAVRNALVAGASRGEISVRASSSTRAGDIIAVHITKSGDTPQKVSGLYYSNPDQGAVILRSNRMPLYTPYFRPGSILIIPALTNRASQSTSSV